MKKLSIEEKARAYDEALKQIKECTPDENGFVAIYPQEIFPELKESEDDRIRKLLLYHFGNKTKKEWNGMSVKDILVWLEKQGNKVIDFPQNYKDMNNPNGCIVLEDFNGGEGFYKLHLDYLNKKQVEEIEKMIRTWNKESILNYGRP